MGTNLGYKQSAEHVRRRLDGRLATLRAKPRDVSREWLTEKYTVEGLSCNAIAPLVGRDPKTVFSWLRHYGIPTRPRADNARKVGFKPGQISAFKGRKHTPENRAAQRARRLADGHVPYLKGGVHYLKGKNGSETPNWKGGITPERQAFYSSDEWKRACVTVWHRADAKCERCGIDHRKLTRAQRGSFHVHHIVSFKNRALRAEPSNLALLCADCHRYVHSNANTHREFLAE